MAGRRDIDRVIIDANGVPIGKGNPLGVVIDPDCAQLDAFGRHRSSDPYTIFDSQLHNNKQPLFWDETLVGGASAATHNADTHMVDMTLGTTSGDSITRQTFQTFQYQAGKSHEIMMTGVLGEPKTNYRARMGYMDADNGVFLEVDENGARFVIRSSTSGSFVDTKYEQADWNADKMDGTGKSGYDVNFDNTQILHMDLTWLGVGTVRFGFYVDGEVFWAHKAHTGNTIAVPYMQTANLPVCYEAVNTGTTLSSTTLSQLCSTVVSEGGHNPAGIVRGIYSPIAGIALAAGVRTALVSVRLGSAYRGSSAYMTELGFIANAKAQYLLEAVWNPTLGGTPSWSAVSSNSPLEQDTSATTVTGGETLWAGFATENAGVHEGIETALALGMDRAGTSDILTLAVTRRAGSSGNHSGSLVMREHQ